MTKRHKKQTAREAKQEAAEAIESPLLTFREAMAYLNVTEAWLRRKRGERVIPCVKVGHLTHFRREDLDAYIESRYEPAVDR